MEHIAVASLVRTQNQKTGCGASRRNQLLWFNTNGDSYKAQKLEAVLCTASNFWALIYLTRRADFHPLNPPFQGGKSRNLVPSPLQGEG
jgi:hypothetical protein